MYIKISPKFCFTRFKISKKYRCFDCQKILQIFLVWNQNIMHRCSDHQTLKKKKIYIKTYQNNTFLASIYRCYDHKNFSKIVYFFTSKYHQKFAFLTSKYNQNIAGFLFKIAFSWHEYITNIYFPWHQNIAVLTIKISQIFWYFHIKISPKFIFFWIKISVKYHITNIRFFAVLTIINITNNVVFNTKVLEKFHFFCIKISPKPRCFDNQNVSFLDQNILLLFLWYFYGQNYDIFEIFWYKKDTFWWYFNI